MNTSSTLRDVAELAGVSIGTASQALNNRPNVSPETRTRVLDAARTLGYPIRDPAAGQADTSLAVVGMITKRDVGLPLTADLLVNPFYSHIQMGIESECHRRGINLMIANIEVDQRNRPVSWPAMVSEQRIEGLILIGTFIDNTIDMIKRKLDVPTVLVDSYGPDLPFDSVLIDNAGGAAEAANYLADHGHQNIGLIGWNRESPPSIWERFAGFRQALQNRGLSIQYVEESQLSRESGFQGAQNLMRRAPEVTAVLACNDETAIGVLNGLREMGCQVPADVSVIGFDNIDIAREVTPALSTVHVYKTWMGIMGVRCLLERARNPDQPKITVTVTTQLLLRDSTAKAGRTLP